MHKAVYKGRTKDRFTDAVHLFYEYRGHEYIVTDEHNGYSETMKEKHQHEQALIDEMIDNPVQPQEWKYEGSAQEGFDMFWEYCETGLYEGQEV